MNGICNQNDISNNLPTTVTDCDKAAINSNSIYSGGSIGGGLGGGGTCPTSQTDCQEIGMTLNAATCECEPDPADCGGFGGHCTPSSLAGVPSRLKRGKRGFECL